MKSLLVILTLAVMPAAFAGGFHDYFEAGLYEGETAAGADLSIIDIRAARTINDWLLTTGVETQDIDPVNFLGIASVDATSREYRIGGGHIFGLHDRVSLIPRAGLVWSSIETNVTVIIDGESVTESDREGDGGYFVALGLHGSLMDNLEAEFDYRFTNVHGTRLNDWRFNLIYIFTPGFAASIGYRDFEGDSAAGAALRWKF